MTTRDSENECRECEGQGGFAYDTCKGGQVSWVECDHCDGTGKVDDYGNPFSGDRIIYCCFPDCGCDGARLCQAENGASGSASAMNIERGSLVAARCRTGLRGQLSRRAMP
jgi:hypothetical protein